MLLTYNLFLHCYNTTYIQHVLALLRTTYVQNISEHTSKENLGASIIISGIQSSVGLVSPDVRYQSKTTENRAQNSSHKSTVAWKKPSKPSNGLLSFTIKSCFLSKDCRVVLRFLVPLLGYRA